ncbi:MAG TPA: hypothetical protein VN706_07550 [Gemmatimonadaceae bacterium]|nr:hypothetical protein [Gemmatimonadaceae bacterium]
MKSFGSWLWRNLGFVCVALVLVYCVVHAFDPPRLNWGDSGSDYNVMTAGRNFQKYGFLKLRLTPHLLDPALMSAADPSKIYTHYPQLPDLMNGVERVVFGFSSLVQFRFVALAFSFAALFFVYALIRHYWTRQVAQIALGLWVVNPMWIQHADYLHHAPYGAFFGFGSVYFLMRYLSDAPKRRFFAASGVFLFFAFFASYDFWFFAPLLLALVTVKELGGVSLSAVKVLASLAAFAVVAMACKFATNAWVLGGWGPFLADLRFQALERSKNPSMHIDIARGILPTLYGRVDREFSLLLFPVAAFWAFAPMIRKRWGEQVPALRAKIPNPLWLMLAALPFLTLFAELWISQYYPTLLALPFYAVACAAVIVIVLRLEHRWSRWIASALLAALFANSLIEDLTFKKAYFDDHEIATLKAQLDSVSEPGQYILTNHLFDFFYSYYFSHPTVDLILNAPPRMKPALEYYSDPSRPRVAPPSGAIFVQHKHLADELFDKSFYYLLAHNGYWQAWADPEKYRGAIDAFITTQDSLLAATVADVGGQKLYEDSAYVLWRIKAPRGAAPSPSRQSSAEMPRALR